MPTKPIDKIVYSSQEIDNLSFDTDFLTKVFQQVGYDGQNVQRSNADSLAIKLTEDGAITYIAVAAPGTAQSTEKWQVRKVDETSGTIVTWADGNSDFDNTATDLTALSYS